MFSFSASAQNVYNITSEDNILGITDEEKNIIEEDKSKNTFENIKYSNNLIKEKMKKAQIAFSTTNYHVFRAGCIANQQCLQMEGIGAKTKTYFWINAFIREFIATLFSEKKKHIIMISAILFIYLGLYYVKHKEKQSKIKQR